jgi:hypothetical protein
VSANEPLAVGDRVRRRRGRPAPGTVVRIVRNEPHQVVEVAWDHLAHPFDRMVMAASQLKRLAEEPPPQGRFSVGDRVERSRLSPHKERGTIVRIIQTNPQIVAVSWDSDPRVVTPERSQRLRPMTEGQNPEHQR